MDLCCHLRSVSRKRPTKYSEVRISVCRFCSEAHRPSIACRVPPSWEASLVHSVDMDETLGFGGSAALSHINSTSSVTRMGYPLVTWMPSGRSPSAADPMTLVLFMMKWKRTPPAALYLFLPYELPHKWNRVQEWHRLCLYLPRTN